jgi:GMP synthase PP-ATPase subunit
MIKEAGEYNKISQAYAALDTNKAVGVMVRIGFAVYLQLLALRMVANFPWHRATNARRDISSFSVRS